MKYCAGKGFFIRPSDLLGTYRARAAADENLNETLAYAFTSSKTLREAGALSPDLRGLSDDVDVNSTKLRQRTVAQRNANS